jgi:hypothetical protein
VQEEIRVYFRMLEVFDSRIDGHGKEAVAVIELVQLLLGQNAVLQRLIEVMKTLAQRDIITVYDTQNGVKCFLAVLI